MKKIWLSSFIFRGHGLFRRQEITIVNIIVIVKQPSLLS